MAVYWTLLGSTVLVGLGLVAVGIFLGWTARIWWVRRSHD
jgi:hypothetical protein